MMGLSPPLSFRDINWYVNPTKPRQLPSWIQLPGNIAILMSSTSYELTGPHSLCTAPFRGGSVFVADSGIASAAYRRELPLDRPAAWQSSVLFEVKRRPFDGLPEVKIFSSFHGIGAMPLFERMKRFKDRMQCGHQLQHRDLRAQYPGSLVEKTGPSMKVAIRRKLTYFEILPHK